MAGITERPKAGALPDEDKAALAAAFGVRPDQFEQGEVYVPDRNEAARLDAMVRQAEADTLASMVSMRMMKGQIDIIKKAAALRGMKYQTYMKDVVFRQACADIQAALGTQ